VKLAQARQEPEQPPQHDYVKIESGEDGVVIKMEISSMEPKAEKAPPAPSTSSAPP